MKTIKSKFPFRAHILRPLLSATVAGAFSASALVVPPGGELVATPSGLDLNLTFNTTAPGYYIVQTSSDLQHWTNSQGVPGDGTAKTLTMTNALTGDRGFYRFVSQTPISLTLPQGPAFAILGHSCGGIQEQVSAGFDVNTGLPTGLVNLSTRCGGSGRGGGYHVTTYSATALVTWDFAGNVISSSAVGTNVVNATISTDGSGDVIYNVGTVAYLVVPVPGVPTGVTAVQSGDQFLISWTPAAANPASIISSTITATPINSAEPVLTGTVAGPASNGTVPNLQPASTYVITVMNATVGGVSLPSSPISLTTQAATILPSAPSVSASWAVAEPSGTTDTLIATWSAADPGNSPVDQYLITITGGGAGTFTQTVSGTTLTAYFNVDFTPNWSVTVKAHNTAGWGPVSAKFTLGGL